MKKDHEPTILQLGSLHIILARHFGFCYGVENAIEIAFKAVEENKGKRIFLLSEMIHNPGVNADLQALGIKFIHQELNLVNDLMVYENLFLGQELTNRAGMLDRKTMVLRSKNVLERIKVDIDPEELVSNP